MSTAPPGWLGTITCTGLVGKGCSAARAESGAASSAHTHTARRVAAFDSLLMLKDPPVWSARRLETWARHCGGRGEASRDHCAAAVVASALFVLSARARAPADRTAADRGRPRSDPRRRPAPADRPPPLPARLRRRPGPCRPTPRGARRSKAPPPRPARRRRARTPLAT